MQEGGRQSNPIDRLATDALVRWMDQVAQAPDQRMAAQGAAVDVLENGELLHQSEVLPKGSDLAQQGPPASPQGLAVPQNLSLIRLQAAVAKPDQACFARSAAAEQNGGFAICDAQIKRLKPTGQTSPVQLQISHQRIFPSWRPTASILA